jgi:hypothetical protein
MSEVTVVPDVLTPRALIKGYNVLERSRDGWRLAISRRLRLRHCLAFPVLRSAVFRSFAADVTHRLSRLYVSLVRASGTTISQLARLSLVRASGTTIT